MQLLETATLSMRCAVHGYSSMGTESWLWQYVLSGVGTAIYSAVWVPTASNTQRNFNAEVLAHANSRHPECL
jgi:hypothetical protein